MRIIWINGMRFEAVYVFEWFWTQIAIAALLGVTSRRSDARTARAPRRSCRTDTCWLAVQSCINPVTR